ncbi:MAG TPA: metalloregulator ArsR/SmtB family transcription factor, partial [Candidatus Krumholzibacterium sp.]|nr:metalloregulator ArsR/SmtB family transcription factor [Candidatus Krumholzibacterium sp.]
MFRVLANPNRLEILRRILADCCSRVECGLPGADSCIGSLAADMDIGAPTVSHHIRELRQAGLIRVEQHGQKRYCYAEKDRLRILAEFLDGLA